MRRLGLTVVCLGLCLPRGTARADAIVVTKAMRATTIAEIFVSDSAVRVEFEIGSADLKAFGDILPDVIHAALGLGAAPLADRAEAFFREGFVLLDDEGSRLPGRLDEVAARKRVVRDDVTGDALAVQPADAEVVVFARLIYELTDKPVSLTIRSAITGPGQGPAANIGFLCYHHELPVNDFRYLVAEATVDLDWSDPWYSRFRHPNLRRQFDAPLSVFLYVEPFEVRQEIIVRPKDLEQWIDLGIGDNSTISAAAQPAIMQHAAHFLASRGSIEIDGRSVTGRLDRIHFIRRTLRQTGVVDPPEDLASSSATLGVIFVYPIDRLPDRVALNWELFGERIAAVPAVATDQAGGLPAVLTPDDPVLLWQNFLIAPTVPIMQRVATPPEPRSLELPIISCLIGVGVALLSLRIVIRARRDGAVAWKHAGIAAGGLLIGVACLPVARINIVRPFARRVPVEPAVADEVLAALLHNTYRAFDRRDEQLVYDRLARSISGELLNDVFLQTRRSIELESQGGARVKIQDVEIQATDPQPFDDRPGFSSTCRWIVHGSVGHWGHIHTRTNQYEAEFVVEPIDSTWKITGMNLHDEHRIDGP